MSLHKKKFLITIDTEGDNLWNWNEGKVITTENSKYLMRFQNIANEFGFLPTWLTDYEMICDERYISFISNVIEDNKGEIGMHLHAWNNPPTFMLSNHLGKGAPYLIEYPVEIMEQKIDEITRKIIDTVGVKPVSHRAGRWAMNGQYFRLLEKYGYTIDCSVTPHINWQSSSGQTQGSCGSDYTNYNEKPYYEGSILEVPVTIKDTHKFFVDLSSLKSVAASTYRSLRGRKIWFRPNGNNLNQMIWLAEEVAQSEAEYIMFMLHSSEMMPGGSPTFKDSKSIEKLYDDLSVLFKICSTKFEGCTLRDYVKQYEAIDNINKVV